MVPLTDVISAMTALPTGEQPPLPRDPLDQNPFGPLWPLVPAPIDVGREDSGRAEPRLAQYPVGWNIPGNDYRQIPWYVLKEAARNIDILRRCIEIRKNHVTGLRWGWTISEDFIEAQVATRKGVDKRTVQQELNEKYAAEIVRLNNFWRRPWKSNNMSFADWVSMLLEELLVLDAGAIYPRMTYGGELIDLEIVDGSTIKPLRDWRGALPLPPHPAYQQILYGFPRGEFTATVIDTQDGEVVPGAFDSDQLYYYHKYQVPDTPYGLSPVEQALISARLYLNRQGWMLAEYDDGTMPLTWIVPAKDGEQLTLTQRREWEQALNDELAGNTSNRYRTKLLPKGYEPRQTSALDTRYKPEYDQHLITILASHLDVTMSELGFASSKGLGSAGFHEGEEDVQNRKGTRPTCKMLSQIIEDLSRMFLDCPTELEFKFLNLDSEDEAAMDAVEQARLADGRKTLNEERDRIGQPRYGFPEADMPMVVTQRGVVFLEGASQDAPPGELIIPGAGYQNTPDASAAGPTSVPPGRTPPSQGRPIQSAPQQNGVPRPRNPDSKSVEATTVKRKASAGGTSIEQRVHDQLIQDFDEKALAWLPQASWEGPINVPLDQIDFSNRDSWRAASEPEKVKEHLDKIKAGRLKPAVLAKVPGKNQLIILDGHHRALAHRKLGTPMLAYVASVPARKGPWDEMHSAQKANASSDKAVSSDESEAEKLAEIGAYSRWLKKSAGRGRAFRFNHLTSSEAVDRGVVQFEDIGVSAEFTYEPRCVVDDPAR
jgi:hypothetical protein